MSLLPPNASAFEQAMELATARIGDVPVPFAPLWDPETCPVDLLPYLAFALSIDSWSPDWPEALKRARVRTAIDIQRHKGTVQSVRDIIALFGGNAVLSEWWQSDPPGVPHTFRVAVTTVALLGEATAGALIAQVIDEITRTKPVRSHFTFELGTKQSGALAVTGAMRSTSFARLTASAAPLAIAVAGAIVAAIRPTLPQRLTMAGSVRPWRPFVFRTGALPAGATFARAGTGTRYNAAGALEIIAANTLRQDFNPFTGTSRGVLIEPARTNQFVQSQDLRTGWTLLAASAPSATQLIESNTSANRRASQAIAYTTGDVVTISATIWEITGSAKRYAILYLANSTTVNAVFDAGAGTFTVAGCTATMTRIGTIGGNPVWRCTMTATVTSTGSLGSGVRLSTSASASPPVIVYQGDGVSGLNVTHLQYEIGAAASSIIPTTTAAVTRPADALALPWGAIGIPDGTVTLRYVADTGAVTDVVQNVVAGLASVPVTLGFSHLMLAYPL